MQRQAINVRYALEALAKVSSSPLMLKDINAESVRQYEPRVALWQPWVKMQINCLNAESVGDGSLGETVATLSELRQTP